MAWNQDKENFLKCSTPHESAEAGENAMEGFMNELAELRRKYCMANVWLVGTYNVKGEDRQTELVFTGGWGQYSQRLDLYAYAFGCAYGDQNELLSKIFAEGEKAGKEDAADHVVGRTDG